MKVRLPGGTVLPLWLLMVVTLFGMGIGLTAVALLGPERSMWLLALLGLLLVGLVYELRALLRRR
ncbi:hypothetical protein ABZ671_18405 [Micromonospora sp. NPDC006766]|uniref:hypothetical protein n=1 Tax=Micromonospora sp. NPDC006766 TaxID=3154778 RepID=UPI00340B7297